MKKALVTGACGFVGSHLVEYLVEDGWEVVATDLEETKRSNYYITGEETDTGDRPKHSYYSSILEKLGIEFQAADITEPKTLEPIFENSFDAVFHTASLYDYFAEWDSLYQVNVEGGRNIGQMAVENDVDHFIHWSTLGVCGGSHSTRTQPIDEEARYDPHNRYSRSKMKQEEVLIDLHKTNGLPLTILRPAPIYGPRHTYGIYHLLYLYRKIGTGLIFPIFPRRHQLKFPSIHVKDLVNVATFVSENKEDTLGEIFHVTSDPIDQDRLVSFVSDAMGLPQYRIPLPWPVYRNTAKLLLQIAEFREEQAKERDLEPKFPASMVKYLTHDFWFTNKKLRDYGYEFTYRDPREGLWEYITWCKKRGLL